MSLGLVAYDTSDDSDVSDAETGVRSQEIPKPCSIASAEVHEGHEPHISDSDSDHEINLNSKPVAEPEDRNLFKVLPQPKHSEEPEKLVKLVADDELEEVVKPKAAELAAAPKPPPKKSSKVKITIPALTPDSDDEDQPKKKAKLELSRTKKSGLSALLPAPVHKTTKESNRMLLPYSLGKAKSVQKTESRSDATKSSVPVKPKGSQTILNTKQKFCGLTAEYSDSEEEDEENASSNFFSLEDSKSEVKDIFSSKAIPETFVGPVLPTGPSISKLDLPPPSVSAHTHGPQDAPLVFNNLGHRPEQNYVLKTQTSSMSSTETNSYLTEQYPTEEEQSSYLDYQHCSDGAAFAITQDEEFLRLQGKKQRGKEEINFVDVHADDFVDPSELQKNLSQEVEHRSSHKKGGGPTSQQKRKKQITYLAHQAKERELELKNQWSQNRQTKRQTQAKYGF